MRTASVMLVFLIAAVAQACAPTSAEPPRLTGPSTTMGEAVTSSTMPVAGTTVTVVAAGDIACSATSAFFNGGLGDAKHCQMKATAAQAAAANPAAVFPLGDLQYDTATLAEFQGSYDKSWGRFNAIVHPVIGNHEYYTTGAAGYFAHFGAAAGPAGKAWYSFDLGSWHIISLNANCGKIGGCDPTSVEGKWLAADLAADNAPCTLAMWHQPAFSSARQGNVTASLPLWQAVVRGGAELVLSGHHHHYERFTTMNAAGDPEPAFGVREIVVGTGGENLAPFATIKSTSEVHAQSFGVLVLHLAPTSYTFEFVDINGKALDSGGGTCHPKPS